MDRLFSCKLGETLRQTFLAEILSELPQFIAAHKKVLFLLPSTGLFRQVRQEMRRISPQLLGWVELKSFDRLAQELSQQYEIRSSLSALAQQMMMQKILQQLAEQDQLDYFKPLMKFPGFIQTCTQFIRELRHSGVTVAEFEAAVEAKDNLRKDQEVLAIYQAYEQALQKNGLVDLEENYFLAIQSLREDVAKLPYAKIYLSDFFWFDELQQELLEQLRNQIPLTCGLAYVKEHPLYCSSEETYTRLVGMGFQVQNILQQAFPTSAVSPLLDHLFTSEYNPPVAAPVERVYTVLPEQEARAMVSWLKQQLRQQKFQPHEVAILIRNEQASEDLRQLLIESGIPVNRPDMQFANRRPFVTFLMNVFKAKASQGQKNVVRNLLKAPYWHALAWQISLKVEQECAQWQLANWQVWERFSQRYLDELELAAFNRLAQAIQDIPVRASADQWAQITRGFLQKCQLEAQILAEPLNLDDYAVWAHIQAELNRWDEEVRGLGFQQQILSLREWMTAFNQLLSENVILKARGDSAGVQILTPEQAGGRKFALAYILGLSEGDFPARSRENWLYNDQERRLWRDLGVLLPYSRQARDQEKYYFGVALSCATQQVVLSTCCNDEKLVSPYFQEVCSRIQIQPQQERKYDLEDLLTVRLESVCHERDLLDYTLLQAFMAAETSDLAAYGMTYKLSPKVWQGALMEESRSLEQRSPFNGQITDPLLLEQLKEKVRQTVFSVSQLEMYKLCPFAYFVQTLLDLSDCSEIGEEPEASLIGQIYHEVLAQFLRRHKGEKLELPNFSVYLAELKELAEATSLLLHGPEKRSSYWPFQAKTLDRHLENWLHYEISEQQRSPYRPCYLEWGFGLAAGQDLDSCSQAAPFTLELEQGRLRFRGKVDRIDAYEGNYIVYDYKRKRLPTSRETLVEGTDLQLPLYLLAVQKLLQQQEQVIGGGYYSIEKAEKNGGIWRKEQLSTLPFRQGKQSGHLESSKFDQFLQNFQQQLVSLVGEVSEGHFPVAPTADCPPFCIGQSICRFEARGKQDE